MRIAIGLRKLTAVQISFASPQRNLRRHFRRYPAVISVAKRAFDIAAIIGAAPTVILIMAVAVLAIAITSGGPIFFIQERVGLRGRTFRMIKLRTMRAAVESDAVAACVSDQRVTPVGKILRQYRIDELPQLWNVLKGDMSLIGPRPEQPLLVAQYRNLIPEFDRRHLVKPGITGLAQVKYGYAASVEETRIKFAYDRFYVDNPSVLLEAKIVVWTMQTVIRCKGAR